MSARILVVAKAPVPGVVKTRLAASIGEIPGARIAAAALLDTLAAARAAVGSRACWLALSGELAHAERGNDLARALAGWTIIPQRGVGLAERLIAAHDDAAALPGPVVQIGMDTPQASPGLLRTVIERLAHHDAALGLAEDGGWWVLGLREPAAAKAIREVPMSTPHTGEATLSALRRAGLDVALVPVLRDLDTRADLDAILAAQRPRHLGAAWRGRRTEGAAPSRAGVAHEPAGGGWGGDVYAAALLGQSCEIVAADGTGDGAGDRAGDEVPVRSWLRPADASDRALLDHCRGATLDIGCGPGRMGAELTHRRHCVLGIDVHPEAVRLARARQVAALCRNVFEPVPAEGGWDTALLADGNIGIGGDPVGLLRRAQCLLAPGGRVVVDLDPPGSGCRTSQVRLRDRRGNHSAPFPWARVGADHITRLAEAAGLAPVILAERSTSRWFAVLEAR